MHQAISLHPEPHSVAVINVEVHRRYFSSLFPALVGGTKFFELCVKGFGTELAAATLNPCSLVYPNLDASIKWWRIVEAMCLVIVFFLKVANTKSYNWYQDLDYGIFVDSVQPFNTPIPNILKDVVARQEDFIFAYLPVLIAPQFGGAVGVLGQIDFNKNILVTH